MLSVSQKIKQILKKRTFFYGPMCTVAFKVCKFEVSSVEDFLRTQQVIQMVKLKSHLTISDLNIPDATQTCRIRTLPSYFSNEKGRHIGEISYVLFVVAPVLGRSIFKQPIRTETARTSVSTKDG